MKYRITRRVGTITAVAWGALILFTIIQSVLNVYVAGVAPEATRLTLTMTAPFTIGLTLVAIGTAIAIDIVKSRRRPVL